jgi:hypothetical protein
LDPALRADYQTARTLSHLSFQPNPHRAPPPVSDPAAFSIQGVNMEYLQTQGIRLPRLGLGTFRMQGDVCRAAVESALALGYRHIDTAEMYGNEDAIGAAIAASSGGRSTRP